MYIVKNAPRKFPFLCRNHTLFLAFFWITGLLIGAYSARSAEGSLFTLMRTGIFDCVSIVGLLAVIALPLLLSAFAVYFSKPAAIFLIAFVKAVFYGCTLYAVHIAFGSAGWLIRFLYTFSDTLSVLFLLWFWIRHVNREGSTFKKDIYVCVFGGILIGTIDYFCISPFLVMLMSY